jgi:hypothetical protein
MLDALLGLLYAFFAYVINVIVDLITALFTLIPDPPFTFFSLLGNISSVSPNFPFGLMLPGITAWLAIAVVRTQLGAIRLFIKGWL